MQYNLFISNANSRFNVLDINESDLKKIVECYNYGNDSVFIKGKKIFLKNLREIQIITFENETIKTGKDLYQFCEKHNLIQKGYLSIDKWITVEILEKFGNLVTDDFITNDFGKLIAPVDSAHGDCFVDPKRIEEIKAIQNPLFEFTKLIKFLEELNVSYKESLFLVIPLITRAIIDHIPPVFNKNNFSDVCGSHGTKSFKESMATLDKSVRKIADSYLHTQIRNKETLPNKTQVNFKHDLDVLLQEIVRLNKKA